MEHTQLTKKDQRTYQKDTERSHEWRCDCGRLLFKGAFLVGVIEVKCPRCKRIVYLQEFDSFTASEKSFMVILDMNGVLMSATSGISEILGYESEEIIGSSLLEMVSPTTWPILNFWLKKARLITKDDHTHLVSVLGVRHKQTKKLTDVTFFAKSIILKDRPLIFAIVETGSSSLKRYSKQYLKDIKANHKSQHKVWDFIINKEGTVTDCSKANILGYSSDQVLGKSLFKILDTSEEYKAKVLECTAQEKDLAEIIRLKNSRGEVEKLEICLTSNIVFGEGSGEGEFVISIIRD